MIRPDHEAELHRFFSGALAAAMGIRSTMGGQIQTLKLGLSGKDSDQRPDPDDRTLEASWEYGRIEATLRTLCDADRRVLRLYYEPMTLGESEGLDIFGPAARIACVLCGSRRGLLALVWRSKHGLPNVKKEEPRCVAAKREAAANLYSLIWQAASRARRAQEAYAAAVDRRAVADMRAHPGSRGAWRPWYIPSVRRRAA